MSSKSVWSIVPKKLAKSTSMTVWISEKMIVHVLDSIMTPYSSSESIGAVQENRLIDALQYFLHHLLYDFVLKITDS